MFKTIAEVRSANAQAGYNWFSRDIMRFWKSRIETRLFVKTQRFVTSEDEWKFNNETPGRVYSVREAQPNGSIKTIKSYLRDRDVAIELAKNN